MRKILPLFLMLTSFIACNSEFSKEKDKKKLSGKIEVSNAWARPASEGGNSAVYMDVYNGTPVTDTLIGIYTGAATLAEIHESFESQEGMAGMRPAGRQAINPGDSLTLKPGGFHVMLIQLKRNLAGDDSLTLKVEFARAGAIDVRALIKLQN